MKSNIPTCKSNLMFLNKIIHRLGEIALMSAFFASGGSYAKDLIGETLVFDRAYPTTSTPYWNPSSKSTTVEMGGGDVIHWQWLPGESGSTNINPEANLISWAGTHSEYIGAQEVFDGFVVSGFSQDISSVVVISDGGFKIGIKPSLRSFEVNLSGKGSDFSLGVQLAPVPEPSAWLMGAVGMCILTLRTRYAQKR